MNLVGNDKKQVAETSENRGKSEVSREDSAPITVDKDSVGKDDGKTDTPDTEAHSTKQKSEGPAIEEPPKTGNVKTESVVLPPGGGGGDADVSRTEEGGVKREEHSRPEKKETRPRLEGEALRKDLIEKCMAALHLCLSRFPTHYKSTYRLAYVYFYSPYHKVYGNFRTTTSKYTCTGM